MVSRCVCYDISFETLLRVAEREGRSMRALHDATGCGGRCGMCVPYIRVLLRSGNTKLPVMWSSDFRAVGVSPTPIDRIERRLGLDERGLERGVEHEPSDDAARAAEPGAFPARRTNR